MRENYTPKLVLILVVLVLSAYTAIPSLGIFPEVEDVDGNGILSELDFKAYHKARMEKDSSFLSKYDENKNGTLDDVEWENGYGVEKESMGLNRDPRFWNRFFYDKRVTLGLDLQGGIDLIYRVESEEPLKDDRDRRALLRKTIQVLKNRIDILGITEPVVQRYDKDHIRVQLAGRFDEGQVKTIIGQTDLLKFQEVIDAQETALGFGMQARNSAFEIVRQVQQVDKNGKPTGEAPLWFLLKRKPIVKGDEIESAFPRFDQFGKPEIGLRFKSHGADILMKETKRLVGKRVAIVLGGEVYMAPNIKEQFGAECVVEGNFNLDYVRGIVDVLKAGSLPAKLIPVHENRIGATLGQDSVERGFKAGKWGFLLVFLLMFVWYRTSGFVANLALAFNLLLLVALMVFLGATMTLPGIAGLILTVGMAVDANVIIFERIREELKAGKSPRAAIDVGFNKAFTAIIDANITSLLTCFILFKFGSGPIQGFAVTLSLGILASMFTAIFVVKILMGAFYGRGQRSALSI